MTDARSLEGTDPMRAGGVVLSLDAMGGDKGPQPVVAGLSAFLAEHPGARVILHGETLVESAERGTMRFTVPGFAAFVRTESGG